MSINRLNTLINSFAYIRKVCIKYNMSPEQLLLMCLLYKLDKCTFSDVVTIYGSYISNWHKVKVHLVRKNYAIDGYHLQLTDKGINIVKEFINDKGLNEVLKSYKVL